MKKYTIKTEDSTTIQIYEFGSGNPKIVLISGIHGDEKTGPLILNRLIKKIKNKNIKGAVMVIPIANPIAYKANSRLHPEDKQDLNRNFPSNNKKTATNYLAKELEKIIIGSELIIDLHVFPNQISPTIGVFLPEGEKSIQSKSKKLIELFGPDLIWKIDSKKTEKKKVGSFCSLALKNNTLAFGLEFAPLSLIKKSEIENSVNSLMNVLSEIKIITKKISKPIKKIKTFERFLHQSPYDGLFIPKTKILERINNKEVIGEIRIKGEVKKIKSPKKGLLMTISKKRIVKKNEKLFTVGY